jgi:rhodanese-related sulfurtransferase
MLKTREEKQMAIATRITADEAKERVDRGEPLVFIDTRNPEAWGASSAKLPGALRITAEDLGGRINEIPRDRAIVTYCT